MDSFRTPRKLPAQGVLRVLDPTEIKTIVSLVSPVQRQWAALRNASLANLVVLISLTLERRSASSVHLAVLVRRFRHNALSQAILFAMLAILHSLGLAV